MVGEPSEWARKEAIRVCEESVWTDKLERNVAEALDAARADGAAKMRERIEHRAAELEDQADAADKRGEHLTAMSAGARATLLRGLLEEPNA